MKVASIETQIQDHALHENLVVVSGAGRHSRSRYVSVKITDTDGCPGFAEAAVVPIWSGESAESTQAIISTIFTPALISATFDHPSHACGLLDRLTVGVPFAKSAIDCALWDLWGQRQGKSVASLIAQRPLPARLPSRASIGAYSPEQTLLVAKHFVDAGIRCLKFKVGVPGFDDVERLRLVRQEFGPLVTFTVDANGAYATPQLALDAIHAMAPFGIALFEQPTHRDRIDLLAQVKKRSPVPVMADESVFTMQQLQMALDMDAIDLLSLYPGKNAGFTRSIEMAQLAQSHGKGCAIGSNLETDIGLASMAALAAALSAFDVHLLPGDFASSLYYNHSSATEPIGLVDGQLVLPTGPGFGVTPHCWKGC